MTTLEAIQAAHELVGDQCLRTPVLTLDPSDPEALLLKAESLQPTGAFKLRGATNAILHLKDAERRHGVITHSSGNHGQAVAAAAAAAGIAATIVMPDDAPMVKIESTRRWGAEVVLVPAGDREAHCRQLSQRNQARLIPPFDDENVIAGQGTIGIEILEQVTQPLDTVLVPVGGGGLISGIAVAVKSLSPTTRVIGVEPELAGDLAESFRQGYCIPWTLARTSRTIADGVRSPCVGKLNWALIQGYVDDVVTVTEADIVRSLHAVVAGTRLVVEPSGAVAPAAYLFGGGWERYGRTVAIVSGGNVDPSTLAELLNGAGEST